MKPRNFLEMIGLRGSAKHYAYSVNDFEIGQSKSLKYAQWLHPREGKKTFSAGLVDEYRKVISDGSFCIDIGAHTGDTTLPMAMAAGKNGLILALEPNPYVYHVLEKNIRVNSLNSNVVTIMAAAGAEQGFMEFEYSDSGFCNGGRHENISPLVHGHAFKQTVFAIDLEKELQSDFADQLPNLSFIKVDAEGYDYYVLRSLENVISEFHPVLKAEVYKKSNYEYRKGLLDFLTRLGYTTYKMSEEPVGVGDLLSDDNLDVSTHYDIIAFADVDSRK